jgi:hypothetical protein
VRGTPPAQQESVVIGLVAHPADSQANAFGEHTGIRHR